MKCLLGTLIEYHLYIHFHTKTYETIMSNILSVLIFACNLGDANLGKCQLKQSPFSQNNTIVFSFFLSLLFPLFFLFHHGNKNFMNSHMCQFSYFDNFTRFSVYSLISICLSFNLTNCHHLKVSKSQKQFDQSLLLLHRTKFSLIFSSFWGQWSFKNFIFFLFFLSFNNTQRS